MLSALRWIKKNIRDYGVDRTLTFHYRTAISQSGLTSPGSYLAYYNMNNARNYSNSVVRRLNCSSDDKQKSLDLFKVYIDRYTRPIIDNYFCPLYSPLAIKNGSYNNISLFMSNNDYEQIICTLL